MKEKALMIFEAICLSYELPKGLTPQQEEDLLWNQFSKYGLDVTRQQLLEWINEKQREVYTVQLSDEGFAVSDAEGQPIKVKVNNFKL